MSPFLLLLVLAQAPPEGSTRSVFSTEPRVGLQLEQGFERYESDARLFLHTRLGADLKASERLVLRTELVRVDRFGKSGFGTGVLADIGVSSTLRLLPGFFLGQREVLAVSSAGLGAVYSGLDLWPGFVVNGWLTLYSFEDSRSIAATAGAVQYYQRFWLQYTFRFQQGLNVKVPGLSHSLSLGARFDGPVRFELGVSAGGGNDGYLATSLVTPALVELHGFTVGARTRLWVLRKTGVLATAWMGEQRRKSGDLAFFRRGVSVGVWTEL